MDDSMPEPAVAAIKAVKKAIEDGGFADYYFVGVGLDGRRISTFSIGNGGEEHAFTNCERWDRLVGAIQRQIVRWEVDNRAEVDVE